ncbi:hypothetical protein [uncultured Weissella sp.]|uniref:hypothetical protein n=1 Tax=uncultured Weissella sp. TaxID=253243 RepID=UPI0027DCE8C8|nr:hypothetical protein [uncultured Weissella sp.]
MSEFWGEWMHVTLGLKVCMIIIWALCIYAGAYIDVLRQNIKWNKKHIALQADKIEELQKVKRYER